MNQWRFIFLWHKLNSYNAKISLSDFRICFTRRWIYPSHNIFTLFNKAAYHFKDSQVWSRDSQFPTAHFYLHKNAVDLDRTDTQRGVLPGLSRERNLRSKIWWFTEFCNSHYVSHFAAFFIVARTKISVAKSCSAFRKISYLFRDEEND